MVLLPHTYKTTVDGNKYSSAQHNSHMIVSLSCPTEQYFSEHDATSNCENMPQYHPLNPV